MRVQLDNVIGRSLDCLLVQTARFASCAFYYIRIDAAGAVSFATFAHTLINVSVALGALLTESGSFGFFAWALTLPSTLRL